MKNYAFDTYCDAIKQDAIAEIHENKSDIIEPISWIKLQQGGQGGKAVTHITLNHGVGKERKGLNEQSFEVYADHNFPSDLGELQYIQDDENDDFSEIILQSDMDEDLKEEIVDEWELPDDVLGGELWKTGHEIKAELIDAGFKVLDDCIICYGDEDNTWGWNPGGYDESEVTEYLTNEDLEDYPKEVLEKLAILFYNKTENRDWFISKAK